MPRYWSRRLAHRVTLIALLLGIHLAVTAASAKADPCSSAIERASRQTGVPAPLLHAIADLESGMQLRDRRVSWPWAVNDGRPLMFRNRETALAHVETLLAAGRENVDIGCMQINWRWHGGAFGSPAALIEPTVNVLYAARYLAALRGELGSWAAAVSAYHSRREEAAAKYRCRVAVRLSSAARPSDCT